MAIRSWYLFIIAFVALLYLPFQNCKAGHVVGGGNITWECVGPDRYEVKVSAYRDCASFSGINLSLSVGCKSGGAIGNIVKKKIGSTNVSDVTPTCESQCTQCGNSQCSFTYGIEKFTSTYLVDLSNANCCKVKFSLSRCCRSNGLTFCSGKNFYIESWFNHCQAPCDNSPKFKSPPKVLACKNQGYKRNLRAYDTDTTAAGNLKDSISYELTCPKTGPNSSCKGGGVGNKFTCKAPLTFKGFPTTFLLFPKGFRLNSQSGQLKFTPTKQEVAPLTFKVKSYRDTNNNGKKELFGEVLRQSQISVINCKPNQNPSITGLDCSNNSKKTATCAGVLDTFRFCTSDPNSGDSVSLTFNRGTLPDSAKWSIKDTTAQYPEGNLKWKPTKNDIRNKSYRFTLMAKDDVCPINGRVVEPFKIKVNPKPKIQIRFDSIACGRYRFNAKILNDVNPNFKWIGKQGNIQSTKDSFTQQFTKPGKYPFKLKVNAQGCSQTYRDTVQVRPFTRSNLKSDTTICKGSDLKLGSKAKDSTGNVEYLWHDSIKGQPIRTFRNLQKDTFMTLKVTDNKCSYKDSLGVKVRPNPATNLAKDSARLCETDTLMLSVDSTYDRYKWNNGDTVSRILVYTQGLYRVRVTDTLGCFTRDSIQLTEVKNDTIRLKDTGCNSFTWSVTNQTYQQSGTYYGAKDSSNFCDSSATIALDLTIFQSKDTTIQKAACGAYTVPSGDTTYRQTGNYEDTVTTKSGCDSVINIDLTINKPNLQVDSVETCESYTWPVNGQTYQQTGTYADSFTNQKGCDSVQQLVLTINTAKQNTINLVRCDSFRTPTQNSIYFTSGTYYDTLSTNKGCDSVLKIQLTIPDLDTAVKQNGQTLEFPIANADNYQWLDCAEGFEPIPGASSRTFTPDSNGRYAVAVAKQGCRDTSSCYPIETIGFRNNDFGESLNVFPNPTKQEVKVQFKQSYPTIYAVLVSQNGQTIKEKTYKGTKGFSISLPKQEAYYILNLSTPEGQSARIKLLKH